MLLAEGENADEDELLIVAESELGNVTVLYPSSFLNWDAASRHLSSALGKPVFSLHVHDGDLWMYVLFADGREVDRFNPVPDYWEELSDEDLAAWAGDAANVCRHWPNVSKSQIANYLVRWTEAGHENYGDKAYPEDEAGIGEDWQIVDFMAKVGLVYPVDEQGGLVGTKYRFVVKP